MSIGYHRFMKPRHGLRVLAGLGIVGMLAVSPNLVRSTSGQGLPGFGFGDNSFRTTVAMRFNNHPLSGSHSALVNSLAGGNDDAGFGSDTTYHALCQKYIGKRNPYKKPAPNVDIISKDTIAQTGSQTGCSTAQNETHIAVNPVDPLNLVAGANDYRTFNNREKRNDGAGWVYTTFDGGATWKNMVLPGLTFQSGATGPLADMDSAGDPALAFGPNNTVYYANLVFSRVNSASGIVVSASHDGGLNWDNPVIVHTDGVAPNGTSLPTNYFNDKEWITVDGKSGAVYVTWTKFNQPGGNYLESPIVLSKSTDGGATWSTPVNVSNTAASFVGPGLAPYDQGSSPQVGPDGTVYVAFEAAYCQTLLCDQPTDHDVTAVASSTDGGATWRRQAIGDNYDFPANADTGRAALTAENFRISSFPNMAVDQQTGKMYVTWADDRSGYYDSKTGKSILTNGDVIVASSTNGKNWGIQKIGSTKDEFFPGVAAYGGKAVVTYYTRRYAYDGISLDYAYTVLNGKSRYPEVRRITTQSSNPQIQFLDIGQTSKIVLQGVFIGDYSSVAMGSDLKFHPIWTDFRGLPGTTSPNQDVYTQSITLPPAK
ncbi:MAG: sialidase family protein [Chloroflexota bacterium]